MSMLSSAWNAVQQFHIVKKIDYKQRLDDASLAPTDRHSLIVHQMRDTAKSALRQYKSFLASPEQIVDLRLLRIHLLLEECAELIWAIDQNDEIETLDGLADLIYVTIGAGITFELPLVGAFDEVQKSNMTKASSNNADNPRLQDKGDSYEPPQLSKLLTLFRGQQAIDTRLPKPSKRRSAKS